MATGVVRYKIKPERVAEHVALVEAVFAELAHNKPDGIRYSALVSPDGVSFTHVAHITAAENPLAALQSFRAFQQGIADRCEVGPAAEDVAVAGDFGLLG